MSHKGPFKSIVCGPRAVIKNCKVVVGADGGLVLVAGDRAVVKNCKFTR